MIDSFEVAKAIKDAINTRYPAASVGIITLPVGAGMPAIILQPLTTGGFEGSWEQPYEMGDIYIQVSCIGVSPEQAAGVQAAIRALLVQRVNSGYTAQLSVNGAEAIRIQPESQGSVIAGDNIFRTDDTYSFKEMLM